MHFSRCLESEHSGEKSAKPLRHSLFQVLILRLAKYRIITEDCVLAYGACVHHALQAVILYVCRLPVVMMVMILLCITSRSRLS